MTTYNGDEPAGPFLDTRRAAAYLGLRPNTLERRRLNGGGPQYRKHGRRVVYHIDDLRAWSDQVRRDIIGDSFD